MGLHLVRLTAMIFKLACYRNLTRTRVTAIGREGLSKGEGIVATGDRSRVRRPFLIRVAEAGRPEQFERADAVVDASGVYGTPCATGPGGLPALGEDSVGERIERHLPDLLGAARARFAGQRVLLVGHGTVDGESAKFNLVGPDLDVGDWGALVDRLPGQVVFVNSSAALHPGAMPVRSQR